MGLKEEATGIATTIAEIETIATRINVPTELNERIAKLHKAARSVLYRHGRVAGLSRADIAEIDAVGPRTQGGGAKDDPQ